MNYLRLRASFLSNLSAVYTKLQNKISTVHSVHQLHLLHSKEKTSVLYTPRFISQQLTLDHCLHPSIHSLFSQTHCYCHPHLLIIYSSNVTVTPFHFVSLHFPSHQSLLYLGSCCLSHITFWVCPCQWTLSYLCSSHHQWNGFFCFCIGGLRLVGFCLFPLASLLYISSFSLLSCTSFFLCPVGRTTWIGHLQSQLINP